jgi:hypothetical protein
MAPLPSLKHRAFDNPMATMIGKKQRSGLGDAKPQPLNQRLPGGRKAWTRRRAMLSPRSPTIRTSIATSKPGPIEHREPLADRVAALERTVRRLERAHSPSAPVPADGRTEAVLTMFSLLLRMLHSGQFDLQAYRAQVTAVAEFFEETAGSSNSDDAAELCRQLLAGIAPKEPRPRPQLRLVSSTDAPAPPAS